MISVFPAHLRATLTGAFMAGGMFGSVLGMGLGGVLAAHLGWRWAFAGMALFGLLLALLYPLIVSEKRIAPVAAAEAPRQAGGRPLRSLFGSRSVIAAYLGSGLQLFVAAAVMVWIPSYLNRYYHLDTGKAGLISAVIVLVGGSGMVLCGILCDRLGRASPPRKIALAIGFCLVSCVLLSVAFRLPPGSAQLSLLALGMLVAAGTSGPSGAMVANLTAPAVHGTAFATLTLANNLLGLAPGPLLTGVLADALGLDRAFQLVPLLSIFAALVFIYARRHYHNDIRRLRGEEEGA